MVRHNATQQQSASGKSRADWRPRAYVEQRTATSCTQSDFLFHYYSNPEINVSSVYPFPDDALAPLAADVLAQMKLSQ